MYSVGMVAGGGWGAIRIMKARDQFKGLRLPADKVAPANYFGDIAGWAV